VNRESALSERVRISESQLPEITDLRTSRLFWRRSRVLWASGRRKGRGTPSATRTLGRGSFVGGPCL